MYVVSNNEFDAVKERLAHLGRRTKPIQLDPNRPTLRRTSSDEPELPAEIDGEQDEELEEERPKLRRRARA